MGTAREHVSLGFPAAGPPQPTGELICQDVSNFLAPFVTFFYDCLSQYPIAKPLQWPNRMECSSVVRDLGQAQLVLIANSSVTGILLLRLSSVPGIVPWVEKTNTLTYVPRALLSRTAVLDMTLAPPGTSLIFHLPTK